MLSIGLVTAGISSIQNSTWLDNASHRYSQSKKGKAALERIASNKKRLEEDVAKFAIQRGYEKVSINSTSVEDIEKLREIWRAYVKANPDWEEREKVRQLLLKQARTESMAGNLKKVELLLKSKLIADPQDIDMAEMYFDNSLRSGEYDEAYYAIMPCVGPSSGTEGSVIRALLINVIKGQTGPGQWEYCVDRINNFVHEDIGNADSNLYHSVPRVRNRKNLEMIAYIALGLEPSITCSQMSTFCYERALKLDPGNPIATQLVVPLLIESYRPEEALAHVNKALPRSRGRIQEDLKGRKKDLEYIVKEFQKAKLRKGNSG
jgi:hypothetical protein